MITPARAAMQNQCNVRMTGARVDMVPGYMLLYSLRAFFYMIDVFQEEITRRLSLKSNSADNLSAFSPK